MFRKPNEVIINGKTLEELLDKHEMWVRCKYNGTRLNLEDVDLSNIIINHYDLTNSCLIGCNLSNSDLSFNNLNYSDLSFSNLSNSNLNYTNLINSTLNGTNLEKCKLSCVNFKYSNLAYANLKDIEYNYDSSYLYLQCPTEGSFIGYKKANDNKIVKLLITEDSLRSSATSRACRCSKAKVLEIYDEDGSVSKVREITSDWDYDFIYKVGEIVEVKDFNTNRWKECVKGIHFFMTFDEALNYNF